MAVAVAVLDHGPDGRVESSAVSTAGDEADTHGAPVLDAGRSAIILGNLTRSRPHHLFAGGPPGLARDNAGRATTVQSASSGSRRPARCAATIQSVSSSARSPRSEEHSLNSSHVAISYAVFCLKK